MFYFRELVFGEKEHRLRRRKLRQNISIVVNLTTAASTLRRRVTQMHSVKSSSSSTDPMKELSPALRDTGTPQSRRGTPLVSKRVISSTNKSVIGRGKSPLLSQKRKDGKKL